MWFYTILSMSFTENSLFISHENQASQKRKMRFLKLYRLRFSKNDIDLISFNVRLVANQWCFVHVRARNIRVIFYIFNGFLHSTIRCHIFHGYTYIFLIAIAYMWDNVRIRLKSVIAWLLGQVFSFTGFEHPLKTLVFQTPVFMASFSKHCTR